MGVTKRRLCKAYLHASRCLTFAAAIVVLYCELRGEFVATLVLGPDTLATTLRPLTLSFNPQQQPPLVESIPAGIATTPSHTSLELRGDMCSKADNLYELAFVQPTLEHAMADDVVLGRKITRMASISS
ncbi:hypothetical protein DYB36_007094 [Aphanomyces astaci]|uniref:Uncharacterized protein n=1 Tax=Aphanomyces astaci TaxID=112090 RepID=A0A397BBK8_APHAT|nr:hypothetical protein DYB36_007094 [Aphanomyces astaci]